MCPQLLKLKVICVVNNLTWTSWGLKVYISDWGIVKKKLADNLMLMLLLCKCDLWLCWVYIMRNSVSWIWILMLLNYIESPYRNLFIEYLYRYLYNESILNILLHTYWVTISLYIIYIESLHVCGHLPPGWYLIWPNLGVSWHLPSMPGMGIERRKLHRHQPVITLSLIASCPNFEGEIR